ncbi:uncharacterized protein [Chironomus tepperi]|uniref:uncharacterized protein n=1 Tax=Chironomus tepperi TaxID=113505 RepID=UPI00391FC55C
MNYNDSVPDAEQTTVCPYNKAHVVLNFRFNNHLIKCRKSYTGDALETCPFNSSHIIPKPEFYLHKKTCIDRKNVLNYIQNNQTDDEELETKNAKLKTSRASSEESRSVKTELNDNEHEQHESSDDRHGDDDQADNTLNNPSSHLHDSTISSNNQHLDQSDHQSVISDNNYQITNNDEYADVPYIFKKPKKDLRGWSDDEDDVPKSNDNSDAKNYTNFHKNSRNYRESSTDSFRSNQSHFQQDNKYSRYHSNSPNGSRSRNSPYSRPESRQCRAMSRESDSNVSTSSHNSQNYHRHSRSQDRHGSDDSSGTRDSSKCRDFKDKRDFVRDNRSREPSRSRESSVGYQKSHLRHDYSSSGHSQRSASQSYSNERFERSNSGNYNKNDSIFIENIDKGTQDIPNSPQNEESSYNSNEDIPSNQKKRKLRGWSDEEDDEPNNCNSNQNSQNFSSSPQNNYISSTSEVDASSDLPIIQKRKLRGWSDDEDDDTPSSVLQSKNFDDSYQDNASKYSSKWDDNANEIGYSDNISITKAKWTRKIFSDRPSDEDILDRFAKLSQFKNFLSVDSWFDKRYRGKMDGNLGVFNWEF